jgi:uncharacterized oxidoreductase
VKTAGVVVTSQDARSLGFSLLVAWGASAENAEIVMDHLVLSSMLGVHSHGVMRLPQYIREIESGWIDPAATPERMVVTGRLARLVGHRAFGQVAGVMATKVALEMVTQSVAGVVSASNAGHAGRIGAYTEAIAEQGFLALAFCGSPPQGHFVAPFGGLDGRLATNPMSYAFPTLGRPVVADFSTSVMPEGQIRSIRNRGLQVPQGVLRDAQGRPTTSPDVLYRDPKGTLQPLGGPDFGYKGSALGVLVEAMSTLLSGADSEDMSRFGNTLTLMALAVDQDFPRRADRLVRYIRSARPIDPTNPVLVPGEREQMALRSATGVAIDATTWHEVGELAGQRGIGLPAPVAAEAV